MSDDATYGACPSCDTRMVHPVVCIACGFERPPDYVGVTLSGKYEVTGRLGSGGMGDVFSGRVVATGQPIAIKVLRGAWARLPEFRTRFRREAAALARLQHPLIVTILELGEHDGALFMAMELVKGEPLSKLVLIDGQAMPLARIVPIFDQLLEVLDVVHAAGIVHRDLKSENVMVTRAEGGAFRLKVLDFGLASMEEGSGAPRLTASGMVLGTPWYMAPEQCRGERAGAPADVYAVGIMLFELLAGALPFRGDVTAALMAQHMFVEPPRIAEVGVRRTVPSGLESLVRRAIAKAPADRPTASALRRGLADVMSGTDTDALLARAARDRTHAFELSRAERAITPLAEPSIRQKSETIVAASVRVVVWASDSPRGERLRDALAVNKLGVTLVTGNEPPPLDGIAVVVLVADGRVLERTRALRSVLVLVADVADARQTAELIRAGASDVALASAGDDEIAKKTLRLSRRKR